MTDDELTTRDLAGVADPDQDADAERRDDSRDEVESDGRRDRGAAAAGRDLDHDSRSDGASPDRGEGAPRSSERSAADELSEPASARAGGTSSDDARATALGDGAPEAPSEDEGGGDAPFGSETAGDAGPGVVDPGPVAVADGASATRRAADGDSGPLLPPDQIERFTNRWHDVQAGFVDEPRTSVEQADALVADLMQRLAASFSKERDALEGQWDRGDEVSTEELRVALTRYRSFFDRLLSA
jgi:hypothetical protein